MNPEQSPVNVSTRTMYQYANHTNIPWNITQYQPLKEYLDPREIVTQKRYSTQKKGEKNTLYTTKRGFYMDYDLKIAKTIPAANHYTKQEFWDFEQLKKKSLKKKIDKKVIKNTFLEQIQIQQKNRKKPGISTYHIIPSLEDTEEEKKKLSEKKRSVGPKRFFYQNTELLSDQVPGPGAHNPRLLKEKLKFNNTDRKFWVDKHKKIDAQLKKRRLLIPGAATYNPMPANFRTFDHILKSPKNQTLKNGFGTDEKFEYLRQLKIKDKKKEVRPSPAQYNTYIQWPNKQQKTKSESKYEKNWFNKISHGYTQGIYH